MEGAWGRTGSSWARPCSRLAHCSWGRAGRQDPGNLAALAHDAIYLVKAAIEKAGTTDPKAVNDAIGAVTVTEGVVCAARYQADGSHFLNHQVAVASWAADGCRGR